MLTSFTRHSRLDLALGFSLYVYLDRHHDDNDKATGLSTWGRRAGLAHPSLLSRSKGDVHHLSNIEDLVKLSVSLLQEIEILTGRGSRTESRLYVYFFS